VDVGAAVLDVLFAPVVLAPVLFAGCGLEANEDEDAFPEDLGGGGVVAGSYRT
jgi:hypothetical protein